MDIVSELDPVGLDDVPSQRQEVDEDEDRFGLKSKPAGHVWHGL